MIMEPILKNEIRLDLILKILKDNWKKYIAVMFITGVISSLLIICVPRYYVVRVTLAPEYGEQSPISGILGSAASFLNLGVGATGGSNAIVPEFYPDIIKSTDFLVGLMSAPVKSQDGEFSGTYAQYLTSREKAPWWWVVIAKVKKIFAKEKEPFNASKDYKVNPFALTRAEYDIIKSISASIECNVDEKTGVISISANAQDPLVAAIMANNVKEELQEFLTKYRTEKIKNELKHATELCDAAYADYVKAQDVYARFMDKHQALTRQSYKVEETRLSGEMQMALEIYNALYQQKLYSESELQKRTPAFTTLQNATVPVIPTGPKRMVTVLIMTILSFFVYTVILVAVNDSKFRGKE
ncbi:MAG: hypothetical protein E7089_09005 [Bacteroidales bacterium]|nr:hypothetical protein [Bacteroidales bacterium]